MELIMFSATESIAAYWNTEVEQLQHVPDHQDMNYHIQEITPQLKPGKEGKRLVQVPGKGYGENGHMQLLKGVLRRRSRHRKLEKVGVEICKLADGLVSRVCSDCNTSTTPLWRGGPAGPKSLCNACGLRYRKRIRRRSGFDSCLELRRNNWWMKKKESTQEKFSFILQRKLEEEAEAAVLLMALSRGIFVHT